MLCHGFKIVSANQISPHNNKPTIRYVAIVQSASLRFFVITCLNALLTYHIKTGLGFKASALKNPSKLNSFMQI